MSRRLSWMGLMLILATVLNLALCVLAAAS